MAKNVLIVGAGGIGSWLAFNIYHNKKHKQLKDASFTIYDDDTVDVKNIGYQYFEEVDLADYKSEILGVRYDMGYKVTRITDTDVFGYYDCIVSAVDNSIFRKLLFGYVFSKEGQNVHWIDLRSEGSTIAAFVKSPQNTYESMLATLPEEDTTEGSCQLGWELNQGIIQNGNKIVAAIGSQYLLNWYRGEFSPPSFSMRF
jgi:molybdopterin/thiamine biosynthesis adenylyltransferase